MAGQPSTLFVVDRAASLEQEQQIQSTLHVVGKRGTDILVQTLVALLLADLDLESLNLRDIASQWAISYDTFRQRLSQLRQFIEAHTPLIDACPSLRMAYYHEAIPVQGFERAYKGFLRETITWCALGEISRDEAEKLIAYYADAFLQEAQHDARLCIPEASLCDTFFAEVTHRPRVLLSHKNPQSPRGQHTKERSRSASHKPLHK